MGWGIGSCAGEWCASQSLSWLVPGTDRDRLAWPGAFGARHRSQHNGRAERADDGGRPLCQPLCQAPKAPGAWVSGVPRKVCRGWCQARIATDLLGLARSVPGTAANTTAGRRVRTTVAGRCVSRCARHRKRQVRGEWCAARSLSWLVPGTDRDRLARPGAFGARHRSQHNGRAERADDGGRPLCQPLCQAPKAPGAWVSGAPRKVCRGWCQARTATDSVGLRCAVRFRVTCACVVRAGRLRQTCRRPTSGW